MRESRTRRTLTQVIEMLDVQRCVLLDSLAAPQPPPCIVPEHYSAVGQAVQYRVHGPRRGFWRGRVSNSLDRGGGL